MIDSIITRAQKSLSQAWPLQAFAAQNPFWDLIDQPFANVLGKNDHSIDNILYATQCQLKHKDALESVRHHTLSVCQAYFGGGPSALSLLEYAHDHGKVTTADSAQLPALFATLGIPESHIEHVVEAIFNECYGWASFIKWLAHHPDNPWVRKEATLEHLLIIWLSYEVWLKQKTGHEYKAPSLDQARQKPDLTTQVRIEAAYRAELMKKLVSTEQTQNPHDIQAVFCIDTRSERLRTALEKHLSIETFGNAGFFGHLISCTQDEKRISYQSPAIVPPMGHITASSKPRSTARGALETLSSALTETKNGVMSPYALFELIGVFKGIAASFKTFFPSSASVQTEPHAAQIHDERSTMDLADASEGFLRTIGLIDNFSKTVIICGHETQCDNNPYSATLQCGACGGNAGMLNAQAAADALNNKDVRQTLQARGIHIPKQTTFMAACHNTTTDHVRFDTDQTHSTIPKLFDQVCALLSTTQREVMPEMASSKDRAGNWAELLPEYGLVNNAALIIGPRALTRQASLDGRAFLQSYDAKQDADAAILTGIFQGPVVVAHWINMQYYFSSTRPEKFGAGNKAMHSVIPGIGVIEGNHSDLKMGLPIQSVAYQDQLLHTPQRLLVVVQATEAQINAALEATPAVKLLIENEWICLERVDPV